MKQMRPSAFSDLFRMHVHTPVGKSGGDSIIAVLHLSSTRILLTRWEKRISSLNGASSIDPLELKVTLDTHVSSAADIYDT
jgi:hypothetical protein